MVVEAWLCNRAVAADAAASARAGSAAAAGWVTSALVAVNSSGMMRICYCLMSVKGCWAIYKQASTERGYLAFKHQTQDVLENAMKNEGRF